MISTGELFPHSERTVILASAGAGKTFELLKWFNGMLKVTVPSHIALVTFTRKGVENMKERILKKHMQFDEDDLEYVRTLHSLCFHTLGLEYGKLWNMQYEALINRTLGTNIHRRYSLDHATRDNKLLDQYDLVRNGGKPDQNIIQSEDYAVLTASYEEFKRQTGAVDFTDCLRMFVGRGESIPVDAAGIDEAQDLTDLQWDVCNVAFGKCKKVVIAGDDYQTIFSYAGANPDVLIGLAGCSRLVKLEVSHRIPLKVYHLARSITDRMKVKVEKDYQPETSREGSVMFLPDVMSLYPYIQADPDSTWYLLTRNTVFQPQLREVLETLVIPYFVSSFFFIPDKDLKIIRRFYAYKKLGFGSPDKRAAFLSEMHIKDCSGDISDTGIFPADRAALYQLYINKYGADGLYALSRGKPEIIVSNIHRVKGGEADNVVLYLGCTAMVNGSILIDEDSELRTLYVAVTRTKNKLFLIHSESDSLFDELLEKCVLAGKLEKDITGGPPSAVSDKVTACSGLEEVQE